MLLVPESPRASDQMATNRETSLAATDQSLSLLHYNIRNFYSNQADLLDMVSSLSPSIISLNELGTVVPVKTIKQLLFSYQVYATEGTNAHGGAVLAIEKRLKPLPMEINDLNMVAAEITIESRSFVVASVYSPPTERLPLSAMATLIKQSKNFIIAGDFNAKHPEWGCPQVNTKGRQLEEWLNIHHLTVLNAGIGTSLRSATTIDLIISSEEPDATESKTLNYVGSDHIPVLTHFHHLQASKRKLMIPRTDWKLYTTILTILHDQFRDELQGVMPNAEKTFEWFITFEQVLGSLKSRVTDWSEIDHKRPSIPPSLQILLLHKHHLQNKFRRTKLEEDRLRLRSWCYLVRRELQAHKQRKWEQFLSNVASPNPKSFWATVKKLNQKKAVDFSALTIGSDVHRKPEDIIEGLEKHFAERYASPRLDPANSVAEESSKLCKLFSEADSDDVELISTQSDLHFNAKGVALAIQSMKMKNPSRFDKVSNRMIRFLPVKFHEILTQAYNNLFAADH